tara:strand:- start:1349 stop:1765 length:417 start_codon:yes stop_codon:yes gene_type:complete
MAKKTTKKKFSFKNMFKITPDQKQDIATGKFSSSLAPKNSAKDDVLMDLGIKEKNQAYFRDLEDRQKRSQEAMKNLGKDIFGRPASDRRTVARGETAAERKATLLEERKAKGQERRKKFYKQKDERLAKLKAKLLNLA